MAYLPERQNPAEGYPEPDAPERLTITVHALKENKRPVGFAPWPKPKRSKRKKRA